MTANPQPAPENAKSLESEAAKSSEPQVTPTKLPEPQVIPPQVPVPSGGVSYQITAVQGIPPSLWTHELVDKYLGYLKDNDDKARSALQQFQNQQHGLWVKGFFLTAGVVAVGLAFIYLNVPGGKEIVLGAGTFASGFLAGRGTK